MMQEFSDYSENEWRSFFCKISPGHQTVMLVQALAWTHQHNLLSNLPMHYARVLASWLVGWVDVWMDGWIGTERYLAPNLHSNILLMSPIVDQSDLDNFAFVDLALKINGYVDLCVYWGRVGSTIRCRIEMH